MKAKANTPKKKLSYLLGIVALAMGLTTGFLPDNYLQPVMENDWIKSLKEKLSAYSHQLPEDRVYLQTDKPFYEPGDDIWIAAYIRDGESLKPSSKSDIVCVDLMNPKGSVEKTIKLIAKNGKAAGDFLLDKELPGGLYKLRARTEWMRNFGEANYFEKELQVQDVILPNLKIKLDFEKKAFGAGDEVIAKIELNTNENKALANHKMNFVASIKGEKIISKESFTDEDGLSYIKFILPKNLNSSDGLLNVMIEYNGSTESISRSIPIVLNKIDLRFFPEGGDMVYGLESKVAFKAVNEFGKAADIEGEIRTAKGSLVARFNSYHQGMGAFSFVPQKGESYSAVITKPSGISSAVNLPEALERGYVLGVNQKTKEEVHVTVTTTETEELALLALVRGKVVYSTLIKSSPGTNLILISTANFPVGVTQLTLFDSKGIARAERLVFTNKHKQMTVSVQSDKEKYLPREKVKLTIQVKDERGLPMPANLSMAVVNDQLLSFADDKSGNLLSQLLLQQDIKEKIEEPAFYFKPGEKKADQALDYVLMTSGWRRFTWEAILEEELPPIKFIGQKAILAGVVYDADNGKPLSGATITGPNGVQLITSEDGKFSISKVNLSQAVSLQFTAPNHYPQVYNAYDYNQNLVLYLYSNKHVWNYNNIPSATKNTENAGLQLAEVLAAVGKMDDNKVQAEAAPALVRKQAGAMKQIKFVAKKDEAVKREVVEEKRNPEKELVVNDLEDIGTGVADMRFKVHALQGERLDANAQVYYRARQYASPAYENNAKVETRTDFRNTIYWNPDVEIGYSGRKTIEFYTSDDITSFRTVIEGIGSDGTPGRCEKNFFTQLPFSLLGKIPVEVLTEDVLSIPVTLNNNTSGPLGGLFTVKCPEGFTETQAIQPVQTIMPGESKSLLLSYKIGNVIGDGELTLSFKACGLEDRMTQKIKIIPKGFPVKLSCSSQEEEKEFEFDIQHLVNGSLKASFTAFPNVVSDLMTGIDGILQEPYGCFEQTSCTAYPNAMVLDYLKTSGSQNNKVLARANDLLNRGYKRLTTFETANKGYEWFGSSPAHEGLTAYGIMEFVDMKKAGQDVDEAMLDRTARWLLNHRDGKGGFEREKRALHDFGRISDDVMNAYIVYALSEAGYLDIRKEFENAYERSIQTKDAYLLAMMANAAFLLKDTKKAEEALKMLIKLQKEDGGFYGSTHSITYSQGQSLTIETTAISIMALLKSQQRDMHVISKAVKYLVNSRNGSGAFSSTQGTILALKALTQFAKDSKKTSEDGTIQVYVDGKKVQELNYRAGDKDPLSAKSLEKYLVGEGKHRIRIKYVGVKTPLPFSVSVNYNTSLPKSDLECTVDLKTGLAAQTVKVGETLRLQVLLTNKTATEIPSTMAIIGLPAGLTAQPWQLKEMQEKGLIDYYEIKGNNLALYYRGMEASSIKQINFDLKAELPGIYDSPASTAYLYYTNEFKTWCSGGKITVLKN